MPNLFFKQELKRIHQALKIEIIKQGIEHGILISLFALGYSGRNYEIILIKSDYKLPIESINKIVDDIHDLEIYYFRQKNNSGSYRISCFGVSAEGYLSDKDVLDFLNSNFEKWEKFSSKSCVSDNIYLNFNNEVVQGELAYIGFLTSDSTVRNLDDLLSIKLVEEIFNLKTSVLTKIRNQGLCYTTVSKFHDDLNVVFNGIVVSYSPELLTKLYNMFKEVEISQNDFVDAKKRLKKEIVFSTTLYQIEHYLLPYQLLNPNLDVQLLLELIERINYEDISCILSNKKFVCLKI